MTGAAMHLFYTGIVRQRHMPCLAVTVGSCEECHICHIQTLALFFF